MMLRKEFCFEEICRRRCNLKEESKYKVIQVRNYIKSLTLRKECLSIMYLTAVSLFLNKKILATPCYLCQFLISGTLLETDMMGPVLILGTRTHGMPMHGEVKSSSQLRFPLSVAKIARVVIVFVCVCLCVQFCCELWRGKNDWIRPVHSLGVWARPIWFFWSLGWIVTVPRPVFHHFDLCFLFYLYSSLEFRTYKITRIPLQKQFDLVNRSPPHDVM